MESNTYPKGNIMTATDIFAGTNDMEHLSTIARAIVRQMGEVPTDLNSRYITADDFSLTGASSIQIYDDGTVVEALIFGAGIRITVMNGRVTEHNFAGIDLPPASVNAYFGGHTCPGEADANLAFYDRITTAGKWDELADEYAMLDEWWHDMRNWFPTEAWERYRELGNIMFA